MKAVGYSIVAILVLCAISIGWNVYQVAVTLKQGETNTYITVASLLVPFVSAVGVAFLSFSLSRSADEYKNKLALELERDKAQISASVNKELARFNSELQASTTKAAQTMKAELDRASDLFKVNIGQFIPARFESAKDMFSAIAKYYRVLAQYEAGRYDEDALKAMQQECSDAHANALLLDKDDEDLFNQAFQRCNFLREKGFQRASSPDGLRSIWREEGRELATLMTNFKRHLQEQLRFPMPPEQGV